MSREMFSTISARLPPVSLWIFTETTKNMRSGHATRWERLSRASWTLPPKLTSSRVLPNSSPMGAGNSCWTMVRPVGKVWPALSALATSSRASGSCSSKRLLRAPMRRLTHAVGSQPRAAPNPAGTSSPSKSTPPRAAPSTPMVSERSTNTESGAFTWACTSLRAMRAVQPRRESRWSSQPTSERRCFLTMPALTSASGRSSRSSRRLSVRSRRRASPRPKTTSASTPR